MQSRLYAFIHFNGRAQTFDIYRSSFGLSKEFLSEIISCSRRRFLGFRDVCLTSNTKKDDEWCNRRRTSMLFHLKSEDNKDVGVFSLQIVANIVEIVLLGRRRAESWQIFNAILTGGYKHTKQEAIPTIYMFALCQISKKLSRVTLQSRTENFSNSYLFNLYHSGSCPVRIKP